MALPTTITSITFTGNGLTTSFPCPFKAVEATSIVAILYDLNGTSKILALTTDYSVSDLNNDDGCIVTYPTNPEPIQVKAPTPPLPVGWTLNIQRIVPLNQSTVLQPYSKYNPTVIENQFDYTTMQIQQINSLVQRTIFFPQDENLTAEQKTLPSATERAKKFLSFDDNGGVVVYDPSVVIVDADLLDGIEAEIRNATAPAVLCISQQGNKPIINAKNLLQIINDADTDAEEDEESLITDGLLLLTISILQETLNEK